MATSVHVRFTRSRQTPAATQAPAVGHVTVPEIRMYSWNGAALQQQAAATTGGQIGTAGQSPVADGPDKRSNRNKSAAEPRCMAVGVKVGTYLRTCPTQQCYLPCMPREPRAPPPGPLVGSPCTYGIPPLALVHDGKPSGQPSRRGAWVSGAFRPLRAAARAGGPLRRFPPRALRCLGRCSGAWLRPAVHASWRVHRGGGRSVASLGSNTRRDDRRGVFDGSEFNGGFLIRSASETDRGPVKGTSGTVDADAGVPALNPGYLSGGSADTRAGCAPPAHVSRGPEPWGGSQRGTTDTRRSCLGGSRRGRGYRQRRAIATCARDPRNSSSACSWDARRSPPAGCSEDPWS